MDAGMDVATYLATRLAQAGLGHVFAVPGDYASPFLLAIDEMPHIIERVPTVNELGSGYAADGYARFRGVGAACVQYNVGTFSALNCIAGSFVERVPVALITASPSTADRVLERTEGILFHHSTGDLDVGPKVFADVTVAAEIVRDPWNAPAQIDRAITAMLTHRRPIYIEVLQDVWTMACAPPQCRLVPSPASDDEDALAACVDAAWARLVAAQHAVIWAGVEVQRFGLQGLLQRLVDASGLPFTTTSLGKTVLDEAQTRFMGTYAGPASPRTTFDAVHGADCLLALGATITDDYLAIMQQSFDLMVAVSADGARVGRARYSGVSLAGFLDRLLARVEADPAFPRPYVPPPIRPVSPPPAGDGLTYERFYDTLAARLDRTRLRDEVVLILGESTSLYVFGNLFGLRRDGFVAQAAWGSLGHETGCALGVALGSGRRPYVVAGDGGFMMICQELSSLARAKVNAVVFVMSNRGYAIEQAFVNLEAFTTDEPFAGFDVLPAWNYAALARAFGAEAFSASTVAELEGALDAVEALRAVPALVEVVVPEKDLPGQLARLAGEPWPKKKYGRVPPG